MDALLFSGTTYLVLALVAAAAYVLYRAALPKPLPGIPYHEYAANRLLGDMPEFLEHQRKYRTSYDWMGAQARDFKGPLYQLFINPIGKPHVFLTDWRETQDILTHRLKEFDRSQVVIDVMIDTAPNLHVTKLTNDQFRAQRRLIADTMSPTFLNTVAAPNLYKAAVHLMDLWHTKSSMASGNAFDVELDINQLALDAIWLVAFGTNSQALESQTQLLASVPDLKPEPSAEGLVTFPTPESPEAYDAIVVLCTALESAVKFPVPRIGHWFARRKASWQAAYKAKDRLIDAALAQAVKRISTDPSDAMIDCATAHVVRREKAAAEKEGRAPVYNSPAIRDELLGFLIAGHDTSAVTVMWGVKLLAEYQDAQAAVRDALHAAYPEQHKAGVLPSIDDIVKTEIPLLDATIEEMLRIQPTAPATSRSATCDTEILGRRIPKGTTVMFLSHGYGYVEPSPGGQPPIDEKDRSPTSREFKDRSAPEWDGADITQFKPERWLVETEKGTAYNPNAGPVRPFGAGIRGCFGRRLAYIALRVFFTTMIWEFELQQCPPKVSGYEAVDLLTRKPAECFARLGSLRPLRRDSAAT